MTVRTSPSRLSTAPITPIEAMARQDIPATPVDAPLDGPNVNGVLRMAMQLQAAGDLEAAIDIYRRFIGSRPEHAEALHLLGVAFHQLGDLRTALVTLEHAVAANPHDAKAWSDLGETLRNMQQFDDAIAALEQAIELDPEDPVAACNHAHALLQVGRLDEAVIGYERSVALGFEDTHLRTAQGVAFQQMQRFDKAVTAFERALDLDPTNPEPQYLRAVLRNEPLETAPRAYVESLFDRYATGFDTHLVRQLEYTGHLAVRNAVDDLGIPPAAAWRIADLGCGTGLCGAALKAYARQLVGVDVSRGMIAEAWSKGLYDELIHDDLLAALGPDRAPYDLVVAGDVATYVGDLTRLFASTAAALSPGGHFVLTTERLEDGDGFALHRSSRFAHTEAYLRTLAERHGLTVRSVEDFFVRTEKRQPIPGQVLVLERA